jgi:hypothetical protein
VVSVADGKARCPTAGSYTARPAADRQFDDQRDDVRIARNRPLVPDCDNLFNRYCTYRPDIDAFGYRSISLTPCHRAQRGPIVNLAWRG